MRDKRPMARRRRGSPVWIPAVLSVLTALIYIGFMLATYPGISNDLQAGHWDDGVLIVGLILFICVALFLWPPWGVAAIAAIWAVYGIVIGICWYAQKRKARNNGRFRRATGRTPEEELWFDVRR